MDNVLFKVSRDERDAIVMYLLQIATHGDTTASERLDILDLIETLMKGHDNG